MERIILLNCAVFLFVVLCFDVVLTVPHNYDSPTDQNKRKEDLDKQSAYMWFGPRLGRRKRNPGDEGYGNLDYVGTEHITSRTDALQASPWIIVAVKNDLQDRPNIGVIPIIPPRLGRESGEDRFGKDRWLQDSEYLSEISQRSPSPPFAPRLGRTISPYSPRLGRETDKMA